MAACRRSREGARCTFPSARLVRAGHVDLTVSVIGQDRCQLGFTSSCSKMRKSYQVPQCQKAMQSYAHPIVNAHFIALFAVITPCYTSFWTSEAG